MEPYVIYVSQVFVGSISDVELTRVSGFLEALKDKPGVAIMADRGFTIKDMLAELNVELNMPPFLDGRQQLSHKELKSGRKIASLRIHVERAIGRMKCFDILKETIPISMTRLTNQIVYICGMLTNFQPALVNTSVPVDDSDTDEHVDDYFKSFSSEGSDSDDNMCILHVIFSCIQQSYKYTSGTYTITIKMV